MANEITTDNINTKAQEVASLSDGDFVYVFKTGASGFSRIEKNLLLQGAGGGSSSGISEEVYEAIKGNVNLIQSRLDALIGALANMAFNSLPKPAIIGALTWPEDSTPTPTPAPSLSILYNGTSVNGSTVNTTAASGGLTTIQFTVKAANLTTSDLFNLTLRSQSSGIFNLPLDYITAAEATSGKTITVTYSGTSASSATLTASGNGLTATVNIAVAAEGSVNHTITGTLTHCYIGGSDSVNALVSNGGTWSGRIVTESGYELPTIDSTIITSGTAGSVSLTETTLTISNITSNITFEIAATSAQQVTEYVSTGLVLHLDGKNQGSTPGRWIDRVGQKEFVLIGSPTVVTEDGETKGVTFSTDGDQQYGLYTANNLADWLASECTIEVCFTPTKDFDEEGAGLVSLFSSSVEGNIAATFTPVYQVIGSTWSRGFGFGAIAPNSTSRRDYKRVLSASTTINSDQSVTLSMNYSRQVLNGVVDTSSTVNTKVGLYYNGQGLTVGGSPRSDSMFCGCDAIIHEVRIYNCLLSEQEMKDNQKCDNYRYNLGLNI